MKRHTQILIAALIIGCSVTGSAFAQPGNQRPPMLPDSSMIVERVDNLAETLTLTEQQKSEILKLHFEHFKQMKQLYETAQAQHDNVRKEHDALRTQFIDALTRLLTDGQKKDFEVFNKTHRPPQSNNQMNRNPMQ